MGNDGAMSDGGRGNHRDLPADRHRPRYCGDMPEMIAILPRQPDDATVPTGPAQGWSSRLPGRPGRYVSTLRRDRAGDATH